MQNNIVLKRICFGLIIIELAAVGYKVCSEWWDSANKPVLHVYNWSDYIDPELLDKFEKDNRCKVVIDTFDDNESMLAKMVSGATGYDVIFPSSYVIPVLKKHGLIQSLDMEKLPNVKANFDNKFASALHEDSFKFSVPYAFSITGIAYRNDKVNLTDEQKAGDIKWDFLLAKDLKNRISIMNDIREMLGIGLKMHGKSNNTTNDNEVAEACKTIIGMKKCARRMDNVEYRIGLANGTFYASIAYNSDIFQVVQENPDVPITFVVPKDGANASWDEMCITSTSEQVDLAHKFIDFLYDGEVCAQNIVYVGSAMPNKAMLEIVDDEIKSNPMVSIPKDILDRVELIKDVGDSISVYNKWWDVFMAAH